MISGHKFLDVVFDKARIRVEIKGHKPAERYSAVSLDYSRVFVELRLTRILEESSDLPELLFKFTRHFTLRP